MPGGRRFNPLGTLSRHAVEQLLADTPAWVVRTERLPPVIRLVRCPVCKEWLTQRSREDRQCRACGAWDSAATR